MYHSLRATGNVISHSKITGKSKYVSTQHRKNINRHDSYLKWT